MADHVGDGVEVVVAQRRSHFRRLELAGQGEVGVAPALGLHHLVEGVAATGAWYADVHPLALEVIDRLDAAVGAGDHGENLGLQGKHRPKLIDRAVLVERREPLQRLVLVVGLDETKLVLAVVQRDDVGHAAGGGRRVALDRRLHFGAVEQAAHRLAGGVVDAGLAAGADGDETFLGHGRGRSQRARQGATQQADTDTLVHRRIPPLLLLSVKQGCTHVLRRDGGAHAASLSAPLPTLVQALAAITMISTSTSAEARRASTVARAGAQPAGNHSLQTAFIAAKSASMSFSQICALSSFERSDPAAASRLSIFASTCRVCPATSSLRSSGTCPARNTRLAKVTAADMRSLVLI